MTLEAFSICFVHLGRILAGAIVGFLLAVLGGWAGLFLNLLIGYPWSLTVHQNIQMVAIGTGAGVGSYLAWLNSRLQWYWILGALALVMAGGILGAYLGRAFGPGVDSSYWWSRHAVDSAIHWGGVMVALSVSTAFGLAGSLWATNIRHVQEKRQSWF